MGATLAAAIGSILFLVGLTTVEPRFSGVLPYALVLVICATATWRRLSPVALSPAFYFAAYLTIVAVLGVLLTNALVGAGGTGGVDVAIPTEIAVATADALLAGASIVLLSGATSRGPGARGDRANIFDLGSLSRYAGWFLVFGTLELLALLYFLGVDRLLNRISRLIGHDSSIQAAISMAAIAAVVLVAIAFFTSHGFVRIYSFMLMAGFVAYFISMGTRRLALVPLLILLAHVISRRGKITISPAFIAGATALIALALPLHFRGQWTHGLIPYVSSLGTFELSPQVIATSFNNFLAGFKITAMTGYAQPPIPLEVLWISLNPITGESAGWYEVARTLRINRYTPYSAIGELINYGPWVFVAMLAVLGLVLGLIQRLNDRLLGDTLGRFAAILSLGLIFVFVIQSAQYNLRSDIRYIYLALGIQVACLLVVRVRTDLTRRHSKLDRIVSRD